MPSHISFSKVWPHGITTPLIVALLLIPAIAWSAIITVRSARDELNTDGDCSLREAIASANQDIAFDDCVAGSGADIIEFAAREIPRLFELNRSGVDNDTGTVGDLDITADLTIRGRGEGETILQLDAARNAIERVFDIAPAGQAITVIITDLTITVSDSLRSQGNHGHGVCNGAAGSLRLERVTIRDLQSNAVAGGVVLNEGSLTLDQSSILNNTGGESGGILNAGTLDLIRKPDSRQHRANQRRYSQPGPAHGRCQQHLKQPRAER